LAFARDAAVELLTNGTYSGILERTIPGVELNNLMKQ
jgi:hypothetical protein